MSENAVFRRSERPLEASVVLKLTGGETPPADVVRGIAHLVAASVDGLDSDHVTVVDDGGRMLTLDGEDASLAGLSSRQLAVQREVEGYLEKKAQAIVGQIVGAANARVQVSALVNFDRVERTVQAVDPDKQAVATEQRAEITPGAQGGAASSNVATSYEQSKSTETFSGAIGNVKRLSVAVLVNDRAVPGPRPSALPRTAAELARIDTLVRNAVGVDSARGDKLSVVNVAFDAAVPAAADSVPQDLWTKVATVQKPLVAGAGLLAVMVVALLTMRAMRPAQGAPAVPQLAAAGAGPYALPAGAGESLPDGQRQQVLVPGEEGQRQQVLIASANTGSPIVLHEQANPVRDQVVAIIEQRPEAATRVVRHWLKQD
jgi:flagellar M-ring protein FliF